MRLIDKAKSDSSCLHIVRRRFLTYLACRQSVAQPLELLSWDSATSRSRRRGCASGFDQSRPLCANAPKSVWLTLAVGGSPDTVGRVKAVVALGLVKAFEVQRAVPRMVDPHSALDCAVDLAQGQHAASGTDLKHHRGVVRHDAVGGENSWPVVLQPKTPFNRQVRSTSVWARMAWGLSRQIVYEAHWGKDGRRRNRFLTCDPPM